VWGVCGWIGGGISVVGGCWSEAHCSRGHGAVAQEVFRCELGVGGRVGWLWGVVRESWAVEGGGVGGGGGVVWCLGREWVGSGGSVAGM